MDEYQRYNAENPIVAEIQEAMQAEFKPLFPGLQDNTPRLNPIANALLAAGASEGQAEPVSFDSLPEFEQEWAKVEPSVAFHLIERHAEDWTHAGQLMEAWRAETSSAELTALHERIAGMEKDALDAKRYRFARDNIKAGYDIGGGFYLGDFEGANWDKTIDAAIAYKDSL